MKALLTKFARRAIHTLFGVEVVGQPDFAKSGVIIVARHDSFFVGAVLAATLPESAVFMLHARLAQHRLLKSLLGLIGHIAVEPTHPIGVRHAVRAVNAGRCVVLFPEGRISKGGALMKIYDGPGFIAAQSGADIVPVHVDGLINGFVPSLGSDKPWRLLPRVKLQFLPATRIDLPVDLPPKLAHKRAGDAMHRVMQSITLAIRPHQTLFEALLGAADRYGRSHRFIEDVKQVEYSYRDLLKMALMLGKILARQSGEGERIGLLLPNLAPTLGMLFGLGAFGRVPAMLNYTAGSEAMQSACTAASIRLIVSSRAFVEQAKIEDKIEGLAGVRIIYLEDLRAAIGLRDKLWLMLWALPLPRLVTRRADPESEAVVLFTSGSEGQPKGVVLSHRALLANVAQIRATLDFTLEDKILNALPLFHSFGLTTGGLLPVLTGTAVYLYPSPLHYRVIPELAYDRACTILLGTGTFLGNYAKHAHPYDFYRLRYVIAGAEKLSEAVRSTWFEKFGVRIFEGYGATETAPVLSVNTHMAYRSGSVGRLLPGIDVRLTPVPGISTGALLHVKGPNLMSGYLHADRPGVLEAPQSEAGPGWYNTGDVVDIDSDGFVHIVGRVKRFAKVAGEMVSLEVVEKLATQASPEATHGATTQADATRGETILLFTTDTTLSREALVAAARSGGWPDIAVPRRVVALEALPLLGSGKVDHVRLKQLAEAA